MINYQNNKPFVEGVAIEDIASSHATPMYVYSQKKIEEKYNKLKNTLNAEIGRASCRERVSTSV